MESVWNIVSSVGTAVGALGGVAGIIALLQTRHGNEIAETANRLAKEANGIAADSKRLADDANDLAGKANEISADANAISQRALSVTADQTVYKWRVEYDGKTSTVFLVNDCANTARDVQVFIRHKDQTIAQGRFDEIPPFGEVTFEDQFFAEKILEDRRAIDRANAQKVIYILATAKCPVVVHVAYTTDLGSRRNDEIKQSLTAGKRH